MIESYDIFIASFLRYKPESAAEDGESSLLNRTLGVPAEISHVLYDHL
jgi:hypothetical protein